MKKKPFLILLLLIAIFIPFIIWWQTIRSDEISYFAKLISDQRRYCILYFPELLCPLFYNKFISFFLLFIKNYFIALSLNYLFLEKSVFLLELPLFLLGMYFLFRKEKNKFKLLLVYFFLYPLFGPIFSLDWKINFWLIHPILWLVEAYGIWGLAKSVVKFKV